MPGVTGKVGDGEQALTTAVTVRKEYRRNRWSQSANDRLTQAEYVYSGGVKR